jgi:hypothetical protein
VLRKKAIGMVNVQWACYGPGDSTWEHQENMQEEYPQIFDNFELNKMQDSVMSS